MQHLCSSSLSSTSKSLRTPEHVKGRVLTHAIFSRPKELYNPKAFFTHAAWLDQACAHCPKFPTAASRRSLDRVSVPVWRIILSDPLQIVALVSLYPTN
ncbi:UNVERIFIED_CONTAM: hypothetical protein B566_EDAN011677 [Ephemera danica]|nr:hypothetical protein B566_EDAN011677 [Ephemera danica]